MFMQLPLPQISMISSKILFLLKGSSYEPSPGSVSMFEFLFILMAFYTIGVRVTRSLVADPPKRSSCLPSAIWLINAYPRLPKSTRDFSIAWRRCSLLRRLCQLYQRSRSTQLWNSVPGTPTSVSLLSGGRMLVKRRYSSGSAIQWRIQFTAR